MSSLKFVLSAALLGLSGFVVAQSNEKTNSKSGDYHFTPVIELGSTPVKNQYKSSTCWSFSAESMLESEVLRSGKGPIDLSGMWIVRMRILKKQ
jgi:C1A family cysteine protease